MTCYYGMDPSHLFLKLQSWLARLLREPDDQGRWLLMVNRRTIEELRRRIEQKRRETEEEPEPEIAADDRSRRRRPAVEVSPTANAAGPSTSHEVAIELGRRLEGRRVIPEWRAR
jgi:hypothetical protein